MGIKRVWAMDPEPGPDVLSVVGSDGVAFHRNKFGYWYHCRNGTGYDNLYTWWQILRDHGPVTEGDMG